VVERISGSCSRISRISRLMRARLCRPSRLRFASARQDRARELFWRVPNLGLRFASAQAIIFWAFSPLKFGLRESGLCYLCLLRVGIRSVLICVHPWLKDSRIRQSGGPAFAQKQLRRGRQSVLAAVSYFSTEALLETRPIMPVASCNRAWQMIQSRQSPPRSASPGLGIFVWTTSLHFCRSRRESSICLS
jgi:hypothetical protein